MVKMNGYYCCSENQVPYYCQWAEENNYYSTILLWRKPLSIISKNRFSQNVEFIVRVYEHGTGLRKVSDNSFYDRVKDCKPVRNKMHPTEKPVDLMEQIILLSSDEENVVFDPFMGSGTTGVACRNTNRIFIGCEKDFGYYEVSRNRLNYIEQCLLRN